MNLAKRKAELEGQLNNARKQFQELSVVIPRLEGALAILEEQMNPKKEEKVEKEENKKIEE